MDINSNNIEYMKLLGLDMPH